MNTANCCIPETICGILKKLKGQKVVIILKSGDKELVKVVDVIDDNLLVAKLMDRKFKFVVCDCICAVIADCLDVIADSFSLKYDD